MELHDAGGSGLEVTGKRGMLGDDRSEVTGKRGMLGDDGLKVNGTARCWVILS